MKYSSDVEEGFMIFTHKLLAAGGVQRIFQNEGHEKVENERCICRSRQRAFQRVFEQEDRRRQKRR